jgi:hypothetical protein
MFTVQNSTSLSAFVARAYVKHSMHNARRGWRCLHLHLQQLVIWSLQRMHGAGAVCVLQFTACSRMVMPKLRLPGRQVQDLSWLHAVGRVLRGWQAPAKVLFWLQPRLRCLSARVAAGAWQLRCALSSRDLWLLMLHAQLLSHPRLLTLCRMRLRAAGGMRVTEAMQAADTMQISWAASAQQGRPEAGCLALLQGCQPGLHAAAGPPLLMSSICPCQH